ncbi:nucleotide exchange factor GrpE [Romboutsia sp.]|uniref:nucleotide exchange factor GrpE n=1 Tax=Romboutsia sp. TaxID=1965302 RepID=UPI003F372573
MSSLICGGIKSKFNEKKLFNDFNPNFNEQDFYGIIKTLDKDSSKKINNKNEKILQLLEADVEQLKENCSKLKNELYMKEKELEEITKEEVRISKNIISIIDQVDSIYRYVLETKNHNLKSLLDIVYKQISKQLKNIGIEEIVCKGQLLDPYLHKCVQVIENIDKQNEEIVEVAQKGYLLKGEVIRYASVIIAK